MENTPRTFDDWQRSFAVGRLRIVGILAIVAVSSYALSDGLLLGWTSPGVLYRVPSVLALLAVLVLVQSQRDWVLRHVDAALVLAGCIVALASVAAVPVPEGEEFEEALLAFNQGRFGITLVLFALAVMVPARLRVHLTVQLATLAFFGARMSDVQALLHTEGELIARGMGLLWVCFFADLSVVMFTRLQRSEFDARTQLVRESTRRKAYLDGLVRIGASAIATDPDQQARAVLDELVGLLGAERALLFLAAEGGSVAFRAGRDAEGRDVPDKEADAAPGAVRVPLRMRDHLVGEIALERAAGAGVLSSADEDFLRTLASHAAIALETLRASAELRTARDEALDASRAKDAFLQTMSHELRTPITTMLGYTEMLGEELEEAGDAEHAADVRQARDAASNLLAVVSDALELTQLEAERKTLNVTSFPVADLLAELEAEIQPLAERNGNRLDVRVGTSVGSITSDRSRVAVILRKLLQNACKFTEHGQINCDVSRQVSDGLESVQIRVSDSGIGMTADQLSRCFEPFYQADPSATRVYGGAGLGLTTAERMAETLGGKITARAEPGKGSEFVLTLP
jgi:signal transduction histidine kinase